jgi:hypothetical protein
VSPDDASANPIGLSGRAPVKAAVIIETGDAGVMLAVTARSPAAATRYHADSRTPPGLLTVS